MYNVRDSPSLTIRPLVRISCQRRWGWGLGQLEVGGGDDAQIAQRESISEPGPLKGDRPVGGGGGRTEMGRGQGRREEGKGSSHCRNEGEEGGWRGLRCRRAVRGCGQGKGGVTMTHDRHTRTADTGVPVGTRRAPTP